MGCVFGREVSSRPREEVVEKVRGREETDFSVQKSVVTVPKAAEAGGEVQNGGDQKEENRDQRVRGERRRPKPNPRLSNPPKHLHGEQVAAGWPSWLSKVAGEAINGWTPRRADAFEKIDKVTSCTF